MAWRIKHWTAAIVLGLGLGACQPAPQQKAPALEKGEITKALEAPFGDVLMVSTPEGPPLKVHLTGIQAPRRDEPFGEEARAALEALAVGREIELRYGGEKRWKDGSALAQVFAKTEGGRSLWLQEALVREGHARVKSWKDNQAGAAELLAAEDAARAAKKGVWADPFFAVKTPEEMQDAEKGFAIVEGRVRSIGESGERLYLNFGEDARSDFSAQVKGFQEAAWQGVDPKSLKDKRVRVRGYVREGREGKAGLMMIDHAQQIEVLD